MKRLLLFCLMATISFAFGGIIVAQQIQVNEYDYFSTRLAKINDQLHLSSDQQAKLKPIIENETSLMGQVYGNPVLSREQKLKKYWAIINKSNAKIRPMLTGDQVTAFDNVLTEQKQKYDSLMEEAKAKKKS